MPASPDLTTHVVLVLVRDRFPFTPFELALWLSVTPQLLLALTSPVWGRILDRVGMARCRLLIGLLFVAQLACSFVGIVAGVSWLVVAGSVFLGIGNGGGQVTWALASTFCAPRECDVPVYNGIHFVFNGIRGLVMPWVGALLLVLVGTRSNVVALLVCLLSVPVILRLLRLERAAGSGQGSGVGSQRSGIRSEGSGVRKEKASSGACPRQDELGESAVFPDL
jgi:MFS family permease